MFGELMYSLVEQRNEWTNGWDIGKRLWKIAEKSKSGLGNSLAESKSASTSLGQRGHLLNVLALAGKRSVSSVLCSFVS